MRVLLDECVSRKLAALLVGHDVSTVPRQGWTGLKNGQLLRRASADFDAFVTVDQGIPYQINVQGLSLSVIVIRAKSGVIESLAPVVPKLLALLASASPGRAHFVSAS